MINKLVYNYKIVFLIVCFSGISIHSQAQGIKLISYNILKGMERDTTKGKQVFIDWVKWQNPDILALQECNHFTQKSLEEMAAKYNHPYAVLLQEQGYPVAITSKFPIVNVHKITDNMHHGFITGKVNGINFIVLHLSPHNYIKRRQEIDVILSTVAAAPSKRKWIIMGDFNSVSPLDKANYQDGGLVASYQESAKESSFKHNLIDGKYLDFEVQQKILDFGMHDAAKTLETGKEPKPFQRIDYIYVSKDLLSTISRAEFIRDSFTDHYSDHIPAVMEFKN